MPRGVIALESKEDGIGFQCWPASQVVSEYLSNTPELVAGKSVIELGAGCGTVGLTCAQLGAARVLLTDRPENLPHLRRNIEANEGESRVVEAQALLWGDTRDIESARSWLQGQQGQLLVVVSDCTYWQHLHDPLLQTLRGLSPGELVLAHHWRRPEIEQRFFTELRRISHEDAGKEGLHEVTDVVVAGKLSNEGMPEGSQSIVVYRMDLRTDCKADVEPEVDLEALLRRISLIEADLATIEPCDAVDYLPYASSPSLRQDT